MKFTLLALSLFALAPLGAGASSQCPLQQVGSYTPTNGANLLGCVVSLDGDTCVLGGCIGGTRVFERDAEGVWDSGQFLVGPVSAGYGFKVAVSGDTILASVDLDDGYVWVFERDHGGAENWGFSAQLEPSDPLPGSDFGDSVAIDGDLVAVGRTEFSVGRGAAYVFERDPGTGSWSEVAKLEPPSSSTSSTFGNSVALHDGGLLLVGDVLAESAYLFERDSLGAWNPVHVFSDPQPNFTGMAESSALNDDYVVIGRPGFFVGGSSSAGSVLVYERDLGGPNNWGLATTLTEPIPGFHNEFGRGLSLSGSRVAVGSPFSGKGSVYIYDRLSGPAASWSLTEEPQPIGLNLFQDFGYGLALQGSTLAVGAPRVTAGGTGHAFFFDEPRPANYCTAGVSASGCMAAISGAGTPSATDPSGFDLAVSGVEGSKRGLFFFGSNGRQAAPWGNSTSFQCVVPPVARTPLFVENGTSGTCDGAYSIDLNAYFQAKPEVNPGAGSLVQAQFWYRDPFSGTSVGTSMSDALELTVCP